MKTTNTTEIHNVIKSYLISKGALPLDADYVAGDCQHKTHGNRYFIIGYSRPSASIIKNRTKKFSVTVELKFPDKFTNWEKIATARLRYKTERVGGVNTFSVSLDKFSYINPEIQY